MKAGFSAVLKSDNPIFYTPILDQEGFTRQNADRGSVYFKRDQLGSNLEREILIQFVAPNVPATAIQQQTANLPCDIIINRRSRYKVDDCVLSFTVSVANAQVTLAPAPLCIDHIEIAGGGGSKLIQTIYGENLFYNLMSMSEEQLTGIANLIGITPDFYTSLNIIPSGATKTFYVPLLGNIFAQSKMYLGGVNEDIRVRVYFTMGVEAGTATNVTLTNCSVWLICKDLPEFQDQELEKFYLNNRLEFPFLNNTLFQISQTFNTGTQYSLPNNNAIQGMCPFAIMSFRSSLSNTNAGRRTFTYLGDSGYWFIADATGVNLWSSTQLPPALTRFLLNSYNLPSKLIDKLPLIPILPGEPVPALQGNRNSGFYYFTGKEQFVIYPGSNNAETAEVQTVATYYNVGIRTASTPTSGNYTLSYRGSTTTLLAYNASAATILAALQALDSVQRENLTLAVSAALSTSGSFTITISNMAGRVPSQSGGVFVMNMSDLSDGTHSLFGETAISTPGVLGNYYGAGWTNGVYNMNIHASIWQRICIDRGEIVVYNSV
jgi:hypothetical protein